MKKLFITIACLCFLATTAYADNSTQSMQLPFPATLDRAQIMEDGEIWMSGLNRENNEYWLACMTDGGVLDRLYTDVGYIISDVANYESIQYVLGYALNIETGIRHTAFFPLNCDKTIGEPVFTKYFADAMICLPSSMLVYYSTKDTPWLMLYDSNLNVKMTVEQPLELVPSLEKSDYSLSISSAKETSEGEILLFGSSDTDTYYLFSIGSLESSSYVEIPLELNMTSSIILDNGIAVAGNSNQSDMPGACYLTYVNFDGSLEWQKEIPNDNGVFVAQQIHKLTNGFVLYGHAQTTDDHGNHQTLCLITLTNEGEIVKKIELPEIHDSKANGAYYNDAFYAFGSEIQNGLEVLISEKIPIVQ